jgi:hypothetical protein
LGESKAKSHQKNGLKDPRPIRAVGRGKAATELPGAVSNILEANIFRPWLGASYNLDGYNLHSRGGAILRIPWIPVRDTGALHSDLELSCLQDRIPECGLVTLRVDE